nr:MAG TPA: hypothetical protein [Caudoviricetes sp.]
MFSYLYIFNCLYCKYRHFILYMQILLRPLMDNVLRLLNLLVIN